MLLDFFVEAPGRGLAPGAAHAPLRAVEVDFGDAVQVFNIGAARPARTGRRRAPGPRRSASAACRSPTWSRPRRGRRADGVEVNDRQAYLFEILAPITDSTPEARALFMPAGRSPRVGDVHRDPALADTLERLAAEGPAPFYTGDVAEAVCAWVAERGGLLTRADLAAYETVAREPVRVALPRPGGADQPAAQRRRHPARVRARAARPRAGAAVGRRDRRARWRPRRPSARRSSSRGCRIPASWSASARAGWGRPRTSRRSTPTAGHAR